MKAIETEYKGYRFRSRLEARWAVFFDACGVKWEYEPEGFDLGDGIYYLPDFLLHDVFLRSPEHNDVCDIYVEVKGKMTADDAKKILRFIEAGKIHPDLCETSKTATLVVGNIPDEDAPNNILKIAYDYHFGVLFYNFETIDGDHFGACPGVDKQGNFGLFGDEGNYLWYMDEAATEEAYRRARQARFEHNKRLKVQS